jgi:hypothetical protein
MEAKFIDADAVRVTLDNGDVLTMYRANISRTWGAAFLTHPDGTQMRAPECFTPSEELLAVIAEAEKDAPESMDAFMERTAGAGVPSSLRRLAWATGQPIDKVVEDFNAITDSNEEIQSR